MPFATTRQERRILASLALILILGLVPGGLMALCAQAIVQSLGS